MANESGAFSPYAPAHKTPKGYDQGKAWGNIGSGAAKGAAAGSSFGPVGMLVGGLGGGILGAFGDSNDGSADADKLAALYDALQYKDPSSDPRYAKALDLLQTYAKGTLTPEDRAREYEALNQAQQFSTGQSGVIAADAAARGGGGAGVDSVRQQVAAQGAAKRLGSADVATAGMASTRALTAQQEFTRQMEMNTQMQNQFAMAKAGGQADSIKNLQDLHERQNAASNANRDSLINSLGGMAAGIAGKTPTTTAPDVSASSIKSPTLAGTGYVPQDGFGGFQTSLPAIGSSSATAPVDFGGPMTADAMAKAYAQAMPFANLADPGSAPSTSSGSDPTDTPSSLKRKRGY